MQPRPTTRLRFLQATGLVVGLLCLAGVLATPAKQVRRLPAGRYIPLFKDPAAPRGTPVSTFLLDRFPVTNADFLHFVRANPRFRRSRVLRLFADEGYLSHWQKDLSFPPAYARAPVTNVSWFAARGYCRWLGKRLPTVSEWEYAASPRYRPHGESKKQFLARILKWYSRPNSSRPRPVGSGSVSRQGVHDLHGLVWEWVEDFNSTLVTGESRGDTALERRLFCGSGAIGAANFADYAAFMRYAFRSSLKGSYTVQNLGFRCAGK